MGTHQREEVGAGCLHAADVYFHGPDGIAQVGNQAAFVDAGGVAPVGVQEPRNDDPQKVALAEGGFQQPVLVQGLVGGVAGQVQYECHYFGPGEDGAEMGLDDDDAEPGFPPKSWFSRTFDAQVGYNTR